MGKIQPRWESVSHCAALEENQVHVWSLRLDQAAETSHKYESILSKAERNAASQFVTDSARGRYVVVHGILRKLLAGYLDVQPTDIQFTYGFHGKPFVRNHNRGASLSFSLSRSDEMALLAFSYGRRIGVDLERVRDLADLDLILTTTLSSDEILRLDSLSPVERSEAFYRSWTVKEAYLKAIGEGISRDLRDIEVSIDVGGQAYLMDTAKGISACKNWRFEPLIPADEYVGALAVEGMDWQLVLSDYLIH